MGNPRPIRNLAGRSALVLAIIAGVLVIAIDVAGPYVPFLVDTFGNRTFVVVTMIGILRRVVVGVLALVAVILGLAGVRAPSSPHGAAAAGLALGTFHFVWVLVLFVVSIIQIISES